MAAGKSDSTSGSSFPWFDGISNRGRGDGLTEAAARYSSRTWTQAPFRRHGHDPSRRTEVPKKLVYAPPYTETEFRQDPGRLYRPNSNIERPKCPIPTRRFSC